MRQALLVLLRTRVVRSGGRKETQQVPKSDFSGG